MNTKETLDTSLPFYEETNLLMEIKTALKDYFIATFTDEAFDSFLFTLPDQQTYRLAIEKTFSHHDNLCHP